MLPDELVGRAVHPFHQAAAAVDDGGAVAPGQHSGEKPGNLNILFLRESVRDDDRIFGNEAGLIVLQDLPIEELADGSQVAARLLPVVLVSVFGILSMPYR